MLALYITLGMFFLILISELKITILNTDDKTDVLVRFGMIIYFHINYEAFIRFFSLVRNEENEVSLKAFFEKTKAYIESRKFIRDLAKNSKLAKFKLVSKNNVYNPIIEQYVNATTWIIFSFIKEYVHQVFKKVGKEEYLLVSNNKIKTQYDFDFHLTLKIRIFDVLKVCIKNLRDLPQIIKNFN